MEMLQALQARKSLLESQLKAALGEDYNRSLFGSGYSWGEVGERKLPYGYVGDWIAEVKKLELEITKKLEAMNQNDILRAMQSEDVPPDYRELVSAYFEKLSREQAKRKEAVAPPEKKE
jgi:hypothetical protein